MKKILILILAFALLLPMVLGLTSCSTVKYELRVGVYSELTDNGSAVDGTVAMLMLSDGGRTISRLRFDHVTLASRLEGSTAVLDNYTVDGDDAESAWMKDAKKLEQYAEGKSLDEVLGMSDADIAALGISVPTAPLREAIKKASECPHRKIMREKGDPQCGLAISASTSTSWDGSVSVAFDIAGAVLIDGIVEGAIIDSWCPSIKAVENEETKLLEPKVIDTPTKLALYDGYAMIDVSTIKTEWYGQAQTYADLAVGKNLGELHDLPLSMQDRPKQDPADAVTGCTIKVECYKTPLIAAAKRAR